MLKIEDIQSLFSHIKLLLPDNKAMPRLTKELAHTWCSAFEGYTLEQLKHAATQQAKISRYWPNITEIAAQLSDIPGEEDTNDKWDEMILWWQEDKAKLRAVGLPETYHEAMQTGLTAMEYDELIDQAEREGRYVPTPPPGSKKRGEEC